MSNPLFNLLGGNKMPGQLGQMAQAFKQFQSGFTGNAQQQVQQLLNSGKVSQEQYNQAMQLANQLAPMFGIKK